MRADPGPLAALLEIKEKSESKTELKVKKERANIKIFQAELKSDIKEEKKETTKYNKAQGFSDHTKSSGTTGIVYKEPTVDSGEVLDKSKCDICEQSFKTEDLLNIHKIKNHICVSNKIKSVQIIVDKTGKPSLLINHKESKENKEMLTDIVSSVKSPERNNVMKHNEKPLVGCASIPSTMSSSVKENITKYIICEQCGRTDVRKAGFREHIRRHHSSIRFSCHVCNIVVKDNPTLTKHMTLHDPN